MATVAFWETPLLNRFFIQEKAAQALGAGIEELSRKDPSGSRRVVGMLIRILWSSHD